MASVSNPLTNVVQEAFNLLPAQSAKPARAAQNSTQNVPAQNTANDTVTLASQNVAPQAGGATSVQTAAQTTQPAEIIQYEQITVTAEEIVITGGGNNGSGGDTNTGATPAEASAAAVTGAPTTPVAAQPGGAQPVAAERVANPNAQAAIAPAVNPALAANAQAAPLVNAAALPAATALAGSANSTQQQELVQLDQILRQMGVAPQSISIFNQLAMLLYINDPAALRQFISTLQGAVPQPPSEAATSAAAQAPNAAQTQALAQNAAPAAGSAQTPSQPPSASQAQQQNAGGAAIEALAFQATFAEVQVAPAGNGATNQGAAASHRTHHHGRGTPQGNNAQNGDYTLQFQELQLSFEAIGIEGGTAKPLTRTAAAGSGQGQALNVVA